MSMNKEEYCTICEKTVGVKCMYPSFLSPKGCPIGSDKISSTLTIKLPKDYDIVDDVCTECGKGFVSENNMVTKFTDGKGWMHVDCWSKKGKQQMTFDEALEKVHGIGMHGVTECKVLLRQLEVLGLLKFDSPTSKRELVALALQGVCKEVWNTKWNTEIALKLADAAIAAMEKNK